MKRTIESLTPPENKQVMWLDVSGKIKQLKTYINGEWVVVNDDTENNEEIVKKILEKIDKEVENSKKYSEVYATEDPLLYSDSDYSKMRVVGIELNEGGYVKEWDLGNTAEIIPRLNGGNTTQYKCDNHWINNATGLRTLILGGATHSGGAAGLGNFHSNAGVGFADTNLGFRSSCVVA